MTIMEGKYDEKTWEMKKGGRWTLTFAAFVLVAAVFVALDVVGVGELLVVLGAGVVGAGTPRCGGRDDEKRTMTIPARSVRTVRAGWGEGGC